MTTLKPKQEKSFYVYGLTDPRSGRVFYIGKGKGSRCHSHEKAVIRKGSRGSEKDDAISEILKSGNSVKVQYIHTRLSEDEALDLEAMEIESRGLANLTNVMPKGCKSAHDMAGVGLGRQIVDAYMDLPPAMLKIESTLFPCITPAFLHECLDSALSSSLRGKASRRVVEGISRAIQGKYSGAHSRIAL